MTESSGNAADHNLDLSLGNSSSKCSNGNLSLAHCTPLSLKLNGNRLSQISYHKLLLTRRNALPGKIAFNLELLLDNHFQSQTK